MFISIFIFCIDISYTEDTGKIEWIESPSEAEEYGVKDMSTESMLEFFDKLVPGSELFDKFLNRMKVFVPTECSAKCQKAVECVVKNPNNELATKCINSK